MPTLASVSRMFYVYLWYTPLTHRANCIAGEKGGNKNGGALFYETRRNWADIDPKKSLKPGICQDVALQATSTKMPLAGLPPMPIGRGPGLAMDSRRFGQWARSELERIDSPFWARKWSPQTEHTVQHQGVSHASSLSRTMIYSAFFLVFFATQLLRHKLSTLQLLAHLFCAPRSQQGGLAVGLGAWALGIELRKSIYQGTWMDEILSGTTYPLFLLTPL